MSLEKSWTCANCRTEFLAYARPSRPRRFCSQRCGRLASLGVKQSEAWINARKKIGVDHHAWKGETITDRSGRTRALRAFPTSPEHCEVCFQDKRLDRHHDDGNTANNRTENIKFLCRRCHMTADGRLARMREVRYGFALSQ